MAELNSERNYGPKPGVHPSLLREPLSQLHFLLTCVSLGSSGTVERKNLRTASAYLPE